MRRLREGASSPARGTRPARVAARCDASGTLVWSVIDQGATVAPRPLWSSGTRGRVALVGIAMMLLGGDEVHVDVSIGEECAVELVDVAALIATRGDGTPGRWSMNVEVGHNGTFLYDGAALVAADGSDAEREVSVRLGPGARMLARETLVRGRDGQEGGALRAVTQVRDDSGRALFVDRLELGSPSSRLPGAIGTARVVDSVLAIGWRPHGPADQSRQLVWNTLETDGVLIRGLADGANDIGTACTVVYRNLRDQL